MLAVYRTRSPFFSSAWPGGHDGLESDDEARHGGDSRGQIEGPYHDDARLDNDDQAASSQANGRAIDHAVDRGLAVQPSRLHNEGNEWRDVQSAA